MADTITIAGETFLLVKAPEPQPDAPRAALETAPDLLKPADVAELFGMTAHEVNKMCRENRLPYVQVSERRRVIPRARLLEWLEAGGMHAAR